MRKKCPNILTDRELEIVKNFCLENEEIASEFGISRKTARTHTHNILEKLNCKSRASAIIQALKQELIELKDIRTNAKE